MLDNTMLALKAMLEGEVDLCFPDIVISIGGNYIFYNELKRFLKKVNSKTGKLVYLIRLVIHSGN